MPQTRDPLYGRLGNAYRQALRELLVHYEITIISCVYWRNRAPWDLEARKCFDSFLLFPVRGTLRLTVEGHRAIVRPGEYLAIPEGERHSLVLEKNHVDLEQISIHCNIQDRWRRPFLSRFGKRIASLDDPDRCHRVLADLASMMNSDPELGRNWGKTLVLELMAERLRKEKQLLPLHCNGDPRIGQVLRRMKDEMASPGLSIESLAGDINLTATQMRKLFRRETGHRPGKYLHHLRFEKSVYLLRHTTQTVKEIAFECGFASDNYFHLAFRNVFGITPGDFRKKEIL